MRIEWTSKSKIDYWKNIEYLEIDWTKKEVLNFIDAVEHAINLLKNKNVIFISTEYKNTYKMVITKQITLFYSIENETISLLRFWNTYQDLNNFKLK